MRIPALKDEPVVRHDLPEGAVACVDLRPFGWRRLPAGQDRIEELTDQKNLLGLVVGALVENLAEISEAVDTRHQHAKPRRFPYKLRNLLDTVDMAPVETRDRFKRRSDGLIGRPRELH